MVPIMTENLYIYKRIYKQGAGGLKMNYFLKQAESLYIDQVRIIVA